MKGETMAAPPSKHVEPPPSVSFNFNKRLKAPAEFKDMTIGGDVTVHVKGKVKSMSQGKNYDNEPYQDFTGEIENVSIAARGPKNLSEARSAAMKKAGG